MPFSEVMGHGSLLRLIASAVCRGTLPPSLLLVGPEGVGKYRVAVALAQVQNCLTVKESAALDVDACGNCGPCRKIPRGSFGDLLLVEPGENGSITVDQVRHVVRESAYRPFEGRRRMVIVREADALVPAAQNALLKTLEEPPDSSQFVLVTSRPDLLLPTVRSRTQRLSFGQMTAHEVASVLKREGIEEGAATAAAAAAGGSVGRAMMLASGELVAARDAAVAMLQTVSRASDPRQRLEAAKALIGKGRPGAAGRQELSRRLRALTSVIRDVELLAARSRPADESGMANADIVDGLRTLTGTYGGSRGVEAYAAVGQALDALDRNVGPKVVADWLACQL